MSNRLQSIAEIVFALTFVGLLALICTGVLRFGGNVNQQITRTNAVTEMHELRAFDDTIVTGDTVISAIRNYDNIYEYDLTINVGSTVYGAGGITSYDPSTGGISPTDSYSASLITNTNGIVTGIQFTKR